MSQIFSIDSFREEADRRFGAPIKIGLSDGTEVAIRNFLRLPEKVREEISKGLDTINSINDKSEEEHTAADSAALSVAVFRILELASGSKKLLAELDGDLAVAIQVLETWLEETQVGEAGSSNS